jgi:hypothetical protein
VHTARGLPAISRGRGRAFIRAHAVEWILSMHQAAIFEFERAAREFARWRAVPEAERSPARPDGGGGRRLPFAQSNSKCPHIGAHAWSYPRRLLTRQAQRS